jgi:hypothetical protein
MLHAEAAYLDSLFAAVARQGGAKDYVARAVGTDGLERIAARLVHG